MTSRPRMLRRLRIPLMAAAALIALTPAPASETISYTYDARGRLVKIVHSGTINNGISACYSYDKGDNRSNVEVSTGTACTTANISRLVPTFSVSSNGPVAEGTNSGFTITKSGTATTSLTVSYATANGSAAAPGDYTAKSGTVTFTTAQTSQTVNVVTKSDSLTESNETFTMTLSSPSGDALLGTATATATITDNNTVEPCSGVSFAANDATAIEGDPLVFTVSKAGTATGSCNVSYATENAGATTPNDYTTTTGTLTFTSAQTSKQVSVPTNDDFLPESSTTEKIVLKLSNPTAPATVTRTGTGTILDNDDGGGGGGCVPSCQIQGVDEGATEESTGSTDTTEEPAATEETQVPDEATEPEPPGRS